MRWIGAVCLCSVLSGWERRVQTRHAGFEWKGGRSNLGGGRIGTSVTAEVNGTLWHISLEVDGDL